MTGGVGPNDRVRFMVLVRPKRYGYADICLRSDWFLCKAGFLVDRLGKKPDYLVRLATQSRLGWWKFWV
jgi:hypothetical protein